jgi:hypothetical protein
VIEQKWMQEGCEFKASLSKKVADDPVSKTEQKQKAWGYNLRGRVLAQQAQGPGFNSQHQKPK